jgi:hypothetical protein
VLIQSTNYKLSEPIYTLIHTLLHCSSAIEMAKQVGYNAYLIVFLGIMAVSAGKFVV